MTLKRRKNRSPNPLCPLSECMALIGGAWTPNLIWYLSAGPRRFSELKADLQDISAKVLSARLKEMEASGIVMRHVVPTSPPSVEYELTALGAELLPVIRTIAEVGQRLKGRQSAASDLAAQ